MSVKHTLYFDGKCSCSLREIKFCSHRRGTNSAPVKQY